MHHVLDPAQFYRQASGRVQRGKIFFLEAALFKQRHRQRIPHGQHRRRRSGGRESQRAGFLANANVNHHLARLGERGAFLPRHRNQRDRKPLDGVEQPQQFFGLAAIGERQYDVVRNQAPEVPVQSFGGVQEKRGRAGARKRGGNLLPDDARLPHPGDHNAAPAGEEGIDSLEEILIQPARQLRERPGLDFEHFPRGFE